MPGPIPCPCPQPRPCPPHRLTLGWCSAFRQGQGQNPGPPPPLVAPARLSQAGQPWLGGTCVTRWPGHLGLRPGTGNSGFCFCPSGVGGTREGSGDNPRQGLGSGHIWGPAGLRLDPGSQDGPLNTGTVTGGKLEQGHNTPRRGRRSLSIPPSPGALLFPSDISGSDLSTSRPVPGGSGMRGAGEERGKAPPLVPGALRLEPWSGSNRQ